MSKCAVQFGRASDIRFEWMSISTIPQVKHFALKFSEFIFNHNNVINFKYKIEKKAFLLRRLKFEIHLSILTIEALLSTKTK